MWRYIQTSGTSLKSPQKLNKTKSQTKNNTKWTITSQDCLIQGPGARALQFRAFHKEHLILSVSIYKNVMYVFFLVNSSKLQNKNDIDWKNKGGECYVTWPTRPELSDINNIGETANHCIFLTYTNYSSGTKLTYLCNVLDSRLCHNSWILALETPSRKKHTRRTWLKITLSTINAIF